jgi:hypothetical protein
MKQEQQMKQVQQELQLMPSPMLLPLLLVLPMLKVLPQHLQQLPLQILQRRRPCQNLRNQSSTKLTL